MPAKPLEVPHKPAHVWGDVEVPPGKSAEASLAVAESYSGLTIPIPVFVRRGLEDGPAVFVTAALHGDEINGAGAIRQLIADRRLKLLRGTLVLLPVVNLFGFDRHERYLPDRRDLNRCFPGSATGSLASRMARILFDEVIGRCDYGIDLHTAAVRRTNFPNLRADVADKRVAELAEAFGAEIVVKGRGPEGSFRREACRAGRPTIVLEAGEVWKVEPTVVEYAQRGIRNVLSHLGMTDEPRVQPTFQIVIKSTKWIRTDRGGFLKFHASPGDIVREGDELATNTSLVGTVLNVLHAPYDGVVLGLTTLPAVGPGDPVIHLGRLDRKQRGIAERRTRRSAGDLHDRIHDDLATSVLVDTTPPEGHGPVEG
jgi:predicted deacylase